MDQDEAQAKREALQARMVEGIDQLVTSEAWQEYLNYQAKFYRYSFGNTLLIMSQFPTATRIMPYGTRDKKTKKPKSGWLLLGRHPRAGEHGIQIWVPRFRMMEVTDSNGVPVIDPLTGKPRRRERLTGFQIGYVFDVSQTDGDPLPEVVNLLQGEDETGLYDRLVKVAGKLGFTVEYGDTGAANGYTTFDPDMIVINPNRSPLQKIKTLMHELGHALMHRKVDYSAHRGVYELEVESVAYIACGVMGIDTSDYSFGYVASWQRGDREKITDLIKESGEKIQGTVKTILDLLDGE